ncbi:MAG: glycosyltransferase [Candidatus Jordarchaeaceae archaeon]
MKSEGTVTVGVCVKNSEATIKEAIESIGNQDFPHQQMELIIVDGCSEDKTLSIIKEALPKTDLRYKILHENIGLGYARQMVVDNAIGDYIIWVDGDMILLPDFVSKQVEFMKRNPKAGIGKGKYQYRKEVSLVAELENIEFMINFKHEGVTDSKVLATSGCIYRVEAIRQVGGFDKGIKGVGEDMDIEHRIRAAGWQLCITSATFYEMRRKTWKSLWKEYFWHGYGGYYLFKKNKRLIDYYKLFPPIGLILELSKVSMAYRLLKRKVTLLLPAHYIFKRIAWFLGFVKSHANECFKKSSVLKKLEK